MASPWMSGTCLGDVVVRVPEAKWENPTTATTEAMGLIFDREVLD